MFAWSMLDNESVYIQFKKERHTETERKRERERHRDKSKSEGQSDTLKDNCVAWHVQRACFGCLVR